MKTGWLLDKPNIASDRMEEQVLSQSKTCQGSHKILQRIAALTVWSRAGVLNSLFVVGQIWTIRLLFRLVLYGGTP